MIPYIDERFSYRKPRTPEQLRAYWERQQPSAAVVAHLRAGIEEFREMLEARERFEEIRRSHHQPELKAAG